MEIILTALGVAMILEGIPCFVAPESLRSAALFLLAAPARTIRGIGFVLMLGGLVTAWMVRQWYTG
ncbi:MAG: DUF2065 domain-containing protein [Nitrospinae bacterium]|nr:DUF2065 domain-containing protein [Nitrospinota bacterium]